VKLIWPSGAEQIATVQPKDLDRVSKFAIVWRGNVDLDLHAFEYAAWPGEPGHVWVKSPGSAEGSLTASQAGEVGRGFHSSASTGEAKGDAFEVYTFWHNKEQTHATISMALDQPANKAGSPNANCTREQRDAGLPVRVLILHPTDASPREYEIRIPILACAEKPNINLLARTDILPTMRIRQ
jgi:hypothetical protein